MRAPRAVDEPGNRAPGTARSPRRAPGRQARVRRLPAGGEDLTGGLPRGLLLPAAVGVLLIGLPVLGMALRVPWARLPELLTSEASLAALGLSLRTSLAATLLVVVLGVPLALLLAWTRFPGARVVRTIVLLPLVLPPVVSGLALLTTFGRRGLLGERLEVLGVDIAFSTTAVILAQAFVAMPFLIISVEGAARTAGRRHEVIAATLGAWPTTVLRRVTLPLLAPALGSGIALAFARCLGEFGATLTFAGSLQGVTRTLPLEIYLQRETDPDAAIALSLILILLAAALVLATQRPGRRTVRRVGQGPDRAAEPVGAP
ncbi:ABC transporter permease [Georgenia sp. MJ170]|uniref:ABC transporter permease n=1 Tax=Georgenia sunbinii TaxID=3117728 RepID=UPI002F26C270